MEILEDFEEQTSFFGWAPFPLLAMSYADLLEQIRGSRYLKPRKRMAFSKALVEQVLPQYDDEQFRDILRVTKGQAQLVVGLIEGSVQFQSRNPAFPQERVVRQLEVALFRLGTKGISTKKVAWIFGVSQGSVHAYTWRCVYAIEELFDNHVVWPDKERKAEISEWFRIHRGFPFAIGAVDGVPFPLEQAPSYDPGAFITRKCDYALGATAVCDHQGLFTFVSTGYIGSMHDSLAYQRCYLYTHKDLYFQGLQYLLADAAYTISCTVMPRYKSATGDERAFNKYHSSARVKVEHGFGLLKNKFASLRNLPLKIASLEDLDKAASWIRACFVLHNIIRRNELQTTTLLDNYSEDSGDDTDHFSDSDHSGGEEGVSNEVEKRLGREKRDKMRGWTIRDRRRQ